MESALLWKNEPVSPPCSEATSWLDDSFYQSGPEDDLKIENDDFDVCENKAELASQILENLESLMDLDELIKPEPSFLLDDKMLPLLDDILPRGAVAVPVSIKNEYHKQQQYIYNDFEVFQQLNDATLTPPQSPPEQPIIATLGATYLPEKPQTILAFPPVVLQEVPTSVINYASATAAGAVATPQPDIARELAVVDELVRTRVEDMQWNLSNGPSSPDSSCSSSDDHESAPEPLEESNFGPERKKKRGKKSNPDDKKSRKKEQNKNAATRYRMKKKAEVEVILNEEKQLLDVHNGLKGQISDLEREIKYLKGLMRDLLKAKGVIN